MSKHLGDLGEISFMLRAKKAGYSVLTAYSSDSKYDCVLEKGGKFFKVQVKSTSTTHYYKDNSRYYKIICSNGCDNKKKYNKSDVDYFAFFIMELDMFYIIPHCEVKSKTVKLKPDSQNCKYSKYKEAYNLIK